MKTPAAAMLWQIWRAQRWGLIACLAYVVIAVIVAQFLPSILARTSLGLEVLPNAGWHLTMPCLLILVYFLAVFSVTGSADFQEKGYAPFMLTLPVETKTLALWPMVYGAIALCVLWAVVSLGILGPTKNAAPIVWPMAALAVMLALLQAISWTPFAQSWLRFIVALPLLVAPMVGVVLFVSFNVSSWIAASSYLLFLPFSAWACMNGVAMARRGDAVDWTAATCLADRFAAWRKPAERPFSSIAAAQFWFEFRVYGRMLPFFVALMLPMFAGMVFIFHQDDVGRIWKLLASTLLTPALFAATLGGQAGNVPFPFLATRPIEGSQVIFAKVKMALASAILSSALVLLCSLVFLMRPAMWESMTSALRAMGPVKASVVVIAVLVVPPLLTWKLIAESLFLGLAGRPWFINACVLGAAALIGVATLLGLWISLRPDLQEMVKSISPWVIYAGAMGKVALAIWLLRLVMVRDLVTVKTLAPWLIAWAAGCVGISSLLVWQRGELPISGTLIVAGVVMLLPINRLAAAPLMYQWNRHR